MEAKEKAKELINNYNFLNYKTDLSIHEKKECALISVEFAREFITGDLSELFDKTMYLFEIKQEILKL